MTSAGRFLTFEGCEGCGKSTQITSTLAWLRSSNLTVHEVREPGGTPSANPSATFSNTIPWANP